jgi:hypothetical protein
MVYASLHFGVDDVPDNALGMVQATA